MSSFISSISRMFRKTDRRDTVLSLYNAIVAEARNPYWYEAGGVEDTINGRFNMLVTLLSLVLMRLEALDGQDESGVALTELFVDDMDGQMRQEGVGDVVVGKRIGKMVSALGGRLAVMREALGLVGEERNIAVDDALTRNVYEGAVTTLEQRQNMRNAFIARYEGLQLLSADQLLAGRVWL